MTKKIIEKNIKLSNEFDNYIAKSRDAYKRIPTGAHIVLTTSADKVLSAANIAMALSGNVSKLIEAHKTGNRWQIKEFKP